MLMRMCPATGFFSAPVAYCLWTLSTQVSISLQLGDIFFCHFSLPPSFLNSPFIINPINRSSGSHFSAARPISWPFRSALQKTVTASLSPRALDCPLQQSYSPTQELHLCSVHALCTDAVLLRHKCRHRNTLRTFLSIAFSKSPISSTVKYPL